MTPLYDGHVIGRAVTPQGVLPDTFVAWSGGVITEVRPAAPGDGGAGAGGGTSSSDARDTGPLILPGLADVHNHGALGHGFPGADAEGCAAAAAHHRRWGTTTLLASTVSALPDDLARQVAVLADVADDGHIDGIHLEGPFINACRCGAQDPRAIVPGDPAALEKILDAGRGHVRAITLAPETERLGDLLRVCAERGLVASFGHTDAGFDATARAIGDAADLGLTVTATHLFNAMPPVHHREPGAAGALLAAAARGEAIVELIADGVHLADSMVDLVMATTGAAGITLVSDAMAAAGMPDGDYVLGTLPVVVRGGVARLKVEGGAGSAAETDASTSADTDTAASAPEPLGAIAGGTSTIHDQVMRMLARGIDPTAIAHMAATTGAAIAGFGDRGEVAVGKRADLLLCDDTPQPGPAPRNGGAPTPPTVIIGGTRKER
ncbi:amidohydrolase family protein [Corynebacterium sp. NPDC060344]|uniref:amidohydrolase family protein n=1 Tax=Corynebacterium sp. NPDC060344 TaxID=3347101 RepID=UPI003667B06F